ncbi:MAG: anhydro-N-acetylmuramic acid kinase [Flavobacteriales bacterium]
MTDNRDTLKAMHYAAIGVMSGSSLDGVDLAWCEFSLDQGGWHFEIKEARTAPYSKDMQHRLLAVMDGSALELARLHRELGWFIGTAARDMLNGRRVDVVASHGHTIFHKPGEGLTTQIGCGATIASISGSPTVCDFRTKDMALGGQGAPLVPLGEKLLFPGYDGFVNLGGIANVAVHRDGSVTGYDIGPCNMALNLLAQEAGRSFDDGGALAASGKVITNLLDKLDALAFYQLEPPRSLGREWFDDHVRTLIQEPAHPLPDRLRTMVEHIAHWISVELGRNNVSRAMFTGGGAFNACLIDRVRALSKTTVELPDRTIIDFKEALIFALLGVLRLRGGPTALASVTGASRDSVGGALYLPN